METITGIRSITILLALLCIGLASCDAKKKTPNRDHIPVLKERIYALQVAVKEKNRAAIDSLLSIKIKSNQQSSDSLLSFVYGQSGDFPFERFGDCSIGYTDARALVDCFVMDSSATQDRPMILYWVYEHDLWLLKRFEAGKMPSDSI